ncbi:MAG TPA: sigma 54-interacting transcriptional regulator [Kofleriaceae bacterium]|nr:sigma 54-interacting transcriptional regulator [Kofleriaceae bacterium]
MTAAITITVGAGSPVRVELTRTLTSVGSAAGADVRIAGVPPQWLLVQKNGDEVVIAALASGQRFTLGEQPMVVDGARISRATTATDEASLSIGALALALAQADDPTAALAGLLAQALAATGADLGAIVLRQGGGHTVAVARDATGAAIDDGAAILSDTVLHDVLRDGRVIAVDDVLSDPRLATIPSVVNLALRSVIAIPMVLGDEVAGALYLGARRPTRALGTRLAADLAVAASLALPLVSQLRRAGDRAAITLGASPVMRAVQGVVARVAPTDLGLLVTGETGTGKELVARAVHAASPRAARPMVAVNCGAIPANLFESELFGHRKGAFTGAAGDRIGRLEAADGSTLFLDEIGELPPAMQAALLRALQEREVVRVGDDRARPVDFRLVCATNRDLEAEVAAGRFRSDLLYRIREVTIELPPLRDRGDDIVTLAAGFLAEAELAFGMARHRLAPAAHAALVAHDWPGNVRELRAVMRRVAVLAEGAEITAAELALPAPRRQSQPQSQLQPQSHGPAQSQAQPLGDVDRPLALARDAFVATYCAAALERHRGNREAAAAALGISTRSLQRYLAGERD